MTFTSKQKTKSLKSNLLIISLIGSFFTGLLPINSALAFNMNPLERPRSILIFLRHSYLLDKVSEPVHEKITLAAYDCIANPSKCRGDSIDIDRTSTKKSMGKLIDGVEWNDDPSRMLIGSLWSARKWVIWMDDGAEIASCHRERKSNCKNIDASYDLLYRSHYGDLQFFHAMASHNGERPKETFQKIMNWAEFTYKVSTGEIQPYVALDSLEKMQVSAINRHIQRGSWSASYLFARNENAPPEQVKLIALGSLLHLIQDSYSDSHVDRVNSCNSLNHNKQEIREFHNYADQKAEEHKKADVLPQWLGSGDLSDSNPVSASAKIINASFNNKSWSDVKQILENEIFKLSDAARPASAGEASCFAG